MKYLTLTLAFVFLFIFMSCSKTKLEKRVRGTWNVTKVEFSVAINGFTFNDVGQNVSGTITFSKNGIGNQNYSFVYAGTTYDFDDNFTYTLSEEYITTSHTDKWLRLINEKSLQKVKYTEVVSDTETRTYTLTLEK